MRYRSNKENNSPQSPLATTSFTRTRIAESNTPSKPRISGFGRAPKSAKNHHSTKPYDRITSIQRAKLRAIKIHKHRQRPSPLHLGKAAGDARGQIRGRHRQPDRRIHIPLQLPKPMIPPVDVVTSMVAGVVRSFPCLTSSSATLMIVPCSLMLMPLIGSDLSLETSSPSRKCIILSHTINPFPRLQVDRGWHSQYLNS